MTGPTPSPGRLTPRQALGWGVAFVVIAILVILFFLMGREVRPALGQAPWSAWQQNSS